ncbi:MAG: efflux RND transporter periplasmic adaptor subunit [Niabella sp.]|nr:MAG: efflux RND transporter periplasmic adaptor subunit [Niabella sp.]
MSTILRVSAIILSASFILSACKNKQKENPQAGGQKPPVPKVDAFIVKTDTFTDRLMISGNLVANESTSIQPEISGRLTMLNIREGAYVSKGTLLGKIYDGDLRAQLRKLQVQLDVQQNTVKRYEELLKINGVSQQEYDLIVLQTNNIKADIEVVKSNLTRTEIRAPFSGKLGLKMVSPGSYVSPQSVLTNIQQMDAVKLDFNLPEKYSSMVRVGQEVSFHTEGSNDTYRAKIIATEPGISENNRSLLIRSQVIGNDKRVIPGKFAKVSISFDPDPNAIMIPSQAIIPQARGKKVAVLRNGEVIFEDVQTTARDSSKVLVSQGLQVGDTVITTGLMALKPGAKVQIRKIID